MDILPFHGFHCLATARQLCLGVHFNKAQPAQLRQINLSVGHQTANIIVSHRALQSQSEGRSIAITACLVFLWGDTLTITREGRTAYYTCHDGLLCGTDLGKGI